MDILAILRANAGAFRCPMCRRSLADCKLRQLDQQGPRYTVEVTCRNCQLAWVVALELAADEEVNILVEEPEPPLFSSQAEVDPISSDELLEVHRALHQHTGPLTALLRERAND